MTYDELVSALINFTENEESSFTDSIPMFFKQAEQRVFNTVLFPALRKNVTGATTEGTRYLACPDDFLAAHTLYVVDGDGAYAALDMKETDFIRAAYPAPSDTGLPRYYAMFGPQSVTEKELTFLLGPTPDAAYTVELHYFYYPESIADAADGHTWLGDNFDAVLLYGALVEAYIFMKGEADVLQAYDGKFKEALAMAKRLGDGLERTDAHRVGQPRIQVT